jgi:hypothetical protein
VNNVIQNNLTNGLIAALLLASPMAGAESQFPASDFKPKVIFQDTDQIAQHGKSAPAAQVGDTTKPDAKYPAAAFQPTVVYKDENYKPSRSSSAAPIERDTSASVGTASEPATDGQTAKSGQSNNWIFLVALAVAGFVFFKRQGKSQAAEARIYYPAYSSEPGGLTGVARYLNKAEGTGVSRYLEKQSKSEKAATGVAKYMAKQVVAPKVKPAAVTGVEKYMSKRG